MLASELSQSDLVSLLSVLLNTCIILRVFNSLLSSMKLNIYYLSKMQ